MSNPTPDAERRNTEEIEKALSGPMIQMTPDSLKVFAEAAKDTSDYFLTVAHKSLSPERCQQLRRWRVDDGYSWRGVAGMAHEVFQGDWSPPSNQIMGMALCEVAAEYFGEHYMDDQWNG